MTSWEGTYNDPIYGGFINVCVTKVNGVNYGQGLFSELGYMRGTIDSNLLWTGSFWTAGFEVKQGTFSLQLSVGTTISYSGTFTEKPGITYSITGSQTSSSTPDPSACFQTAKEYLTSDNYYDVSGIWLSGGYEQYNYVDNSTTSQLTASFYYNGADGGFCNHNPYYLNGQVTAGDFYYSDTLGIELYVMKNATAFYMSWWSFLRVADFNFTAQVHDPGLHEIQVYTLKGRDTAAIYADSLALECFMEPTSQAEANCAATYTSSSDDDSLSAGAQAGVALGVIFAFAFGIGIGFLLKGYWTGKSLASQDANKKENTTATGTINA